MRIIKIDDATNYIKAVPIPTSSSYSLSINMCKGCVYDAKEYCSKARPTNCHLGYIFKKDIPAIFKDL